MRPGNNNAENCRTIQNNFFEVLRVKNKVLKTVKPLIESEIRTITYNIGTTSRTVFVWNKLFEQLRISILWKICVFRIIKPYDLILNQRILSAGAWETWQYFRYKHESMMQNTGSLPGIPFNLESRQEQNADCAVGYTGGSRGTLSGGR